MTGCKQFLTRAAMLLLASLSVHVSAWSQNSVSTITTSENITKKSTVYAGEVVVDGVTMTKYLFSDNMSRKEDVITNLLSGLQGMTDGSYATLLDGTEADAEATGLALCSDPTLVAAMDENWSSAQYVGEQYYTNNSQLSIVNSQLSILYDVDEGFKAAIDALAQARTADIDEPVDGGKDILTHLDTKTVTDVWYNIVDGQVVRHSDINVIYDSEATTVIYTRVELETPQETKKEFVDLGLPSGTLWATCNVGASNPHDTGLFFAWGDTEGHGSDPSDGYLFSWENYKWAEVAGQDTWFTKYCTDSSRGKDGFTDGKDELDPEDDAAYVNWGCQWRMPSKQQLDELKEQCTWTQTTLQEVNGYEVTGPNGNTIFLPTTSWRIDDMLLDGGAYWSRTTNPESDGGAYYLGWDDWGWYEYGGRLDGQCIRPVFNDESPSMASTPLTIEATSEGDITFSITYSYDHPVVLTPIEYQVNGGTWTTYSSWPADAAGITSSTGNWPVTFGDGIHVNAGDKVAFRGTNASYHGNGNGYECHITSTADGYVYGNVMSLIDADNYATLKTLTGDWNFGYLFCAGYNDEYAPITNTTIKSHPENDLVLPATTITPACYFGMFAGCLGLTHAPELPATTLEAQCYAEMFRATGLTVAPELPATEMRPDYYNSPDDYSFGTMDCYMQMFQDCTSLTEAPELPATTLAHGVYQNMFQGCTSLQKAPVLPAAKVADGAYYRMFYGCTSLNYVKCLATDIGEEWAVEEWVGNVSSTGTFVKTYGMTSWQTGDSGIPAGWTVNELVTLNSDDEGNYWATFYSDASYTADENTTVYTAKVSSDQSKVVLNEVSDKTVPAGNAVVLKSNAATATMTCAVGATGTLADNDLRGSATDTATPDNTYMLVKGSNGVGFYHWTGATIPAYRGYLMLSSSAAAREFMGITTDDDSPTAITTTTQTSKDDGYIYDLTGRRLSTTPRRGIYMKNGKKIVIN